MDSSIRTSMRLTLLVLVTVVLLGCSRAEPGFDRTKWMRQPQDRYRQASLLTDHELLVRQTRAQTREMLGAPDTSQTIEDFNAGGTEWARREVNRMFDVTSPPAAVDSYNLGLSSSLFGGVDDRVLLVFFDRRGRVIRTVIWR